MIRIVIADDEPNIVHGLAKILNSKNLGISIVGMAYDGVRAYELVVEKRPDLLISDINMPKMDGIKLLKMIKEQNIDTEVIFISGYQDFEYARSALRHGAMDYLLKPINHSRLENNILKVIASKKFMDASRKDKEKIAEVFEEDNIFTSEVNSNFINSIDKNKEHEYVILNCEYEFLEADNQSDRDIVNFSLVNEIESFLETINNKWIINKYERIFIMLYSEKGKLNKQIKVLAIDLSKSVKSKLDIDLRISVGKLVHNLNDIKESYHSSIENMRNVFMYQNEGLILFNENDGGYLNTEEFYQAQEKIAQAIIGYDKNRFKITIKHLIRIIKDARLFNKELVISYFLATIVFVLNRIEKEGYSQDFLEFDEKDFLTKLRTFNEFENLAFYIENYYSDMYDRLLKYISSSENDTIHKVKQYIENNYSDNIKLKDVAKMVYMNPNYFSGYFKKQTGTNFKDYLTEIRMEEAKKLLMTSNLKVYEISEKVGFTDYRHFSMLYKNKYGCKPSEYKNKVMSKKN